MVFMPPVKGLGMRVQGKPKRQSGSKKQSSRDQEIGSDQGLSGSLLRDLVFIETAMKVSGRDYFNDSKESLTFHNEFIKAGIKHRKSVLKEGIQEIETYLLDRLAEIYRLRFFTKFSNPSILSFSEADLKESILSVVKFAEVALGKAITQGAIDELMKPPTSEESFISRYRRGAKELASERAVFLGLPKRSSVQERSSKIKKRGMKVVKIMKANISRTVMAEFVLREILECSQDATSSILEILKRDRKLDATEVVWLKMRLSAYGIDID